MLSIVLGTEHGRLYTGAADAPWTDDRNRAKVYATPRAAWRAAAELESREAATLAGARPGLYLPDPSHPQATLKIASLADESDRAALRGHWRRGFGEPLPPDLPRAPVGAERTLRHLDEYLQDVNWAGLLARCGATPAKPADLGLDPAFWSATARLSATHRGALEALWARHAPAGFPALMSEPLARSSGPGEGARESPPTPTRSAADPAPAGALPAAASAEASAPLPRGAREPDAAPAPEPIDAKDALARAAAARTHAPTRRILAGDSEARGRRPDAESVDPQQSLGRAATAVSDRWNEVVRDRAREHAGGAAAHLPERDARPAAGPAPLPDFVRRHFVQSGDEFYYRQTPQKLAFTARGDTLRAADPSVSVATALVELAQSRGWGAIKVRGTDDFKRLVWTAATERGLRVEGYNPTPGERAAAQRPTAPTPAAARLASGASPGPRRQDPAGEPQAVRDDGTEGRQRTAPRTADPSSGILESYGPAPYRHDPQASPSYFVRVRDDTGQLRTHWGVDLERALGESGAQIGDPVQLARHGKRSVTVNVPLARDERGQVTEWGTKETQRETWSVAPLHTRGEPGPAASPGAADPIAAAVETFIDRRFSQIPAEVRERLKTRVAEETARLEQRGRAAAETQPANEVLRERARESAGRCR